MLFRSGLYSVRQPLGPVGIISPFNFCYVNHKRLQRLWREEGLRVPQRRRRKRIGTSTTTHTLVADAPNRVWAVDVQFDATTDGRPVSLNERTASPVRSTVAS